MNRVLRAYIWFLGYAMALSLAFGIAAALGLVVWTVSDSSTAGEIAAIVAVILVILPLLRAAQAVLGGLLSN